MFGFWNKKVNNIEVESDKIDSMLVYLNNEIDDLYESIANSFVNEMELLAFKNNRELIIKAYGEESVKLFNLCNESVQKDFMEFFQKKAKNYQSKMHSLIGSTLIVCYMRSAATEDAVVLSKYIKQIIVELQVIYDNQ